MSITHAQLREFADALDSGGLLCSWQLSHATKNTLTRYGLVDGAYITPAGRDAIATVPYLVDATPVEEAPATPETVECSSCDGQGVKRIAHVYELRDHSTGKLTLDTRGTLVVCDAKGCERGRVKPSPPTFGIERLNESLKRMIEPVPSSEYSGAYYKIESGDRRRALLDYAVKHELPVAGYCGTRWVVGYVTINKTSGATYYDGPRHCWAAVHDNGQVSAFDTKLMLVPHIDTPLHMIENASRRVPPPIIQTTGPRVIVSNPPYNS